MQLFHVFCPPLLFMILLKGTIFFFYFLYLDELLYQKELYDQKREEALFYKELERAIELDIMEDIEKRTKESISNSITEFIQKGYENKKL